MCGFAALFQQGRVFEPQLLDAMEQDLFHRGPDSGGQISEAGFGLVFRRLAIMDPGHDSDQPMTDDSGRYSLVFNGEIYNFTELRKELIDAGMHFSTKGDTEVILKGYAHWGERLFDRLEGMYAIVIVDRHKQQATAVRDALGIKPLYVLREGKKVAFASEMHPLKRLTTVRPDIDALKELLCFRFAAGRLSNLEHIEKVPGGTIVNVDLQLGTVSERRFRNPLDTFNVDRSLTLDDAVSMAREEVQASVKAHLQSDVGYTVQLSGGVDSSLITALSSQQTQGALNTFGIRLRGLPQDESEYRAQVIERYDVVHHEVDLSNLDYAEALPRAIRHMEGPVAHSGCVFLMLLCDEIRKVSKVTLTGEGADEFFGGYMRYKIWRDLQKKGRYAGVVPGFMWPWLQRYREIQRYAGKDPAIIASVYDDHLAVFDLFPDMAPGRGKREETAAKFRDFRSRMIAVDQTAYLESLLLRQDKLSMAASVEARVPFTHYPLAKVVNRFSHALRVPGGQTKPILKTIAEPYLPHDLLHRRKVGLALPIADWYRDSSGLGRYLELLTDADSRLSAYGNKKKMRSVVEAFRKGQRAGLPPMDSLVNIEIWLRQISSPSGAL